MSLNTLTDQQLLTQTQMLATQERQLLIQILQHLREIELRRLFCDLGYKSLFDYAVGELRYSEGQAGRRLAAMRLLRELPEFESSIANGSLSLSNIARAQSVFKEITKSKTPITVKDGNQIDIQKAVTRAFKREVLMELKGKTAREGERQLLQVTKNAGLTPARMIGEQVRAVSPSECSVTVILADSVLQDFNRLRALIGPRATQMTHGELIVAMLEISLKSLQEKKFGKRRVNEFYESKGVQNRVIKNTPKSHNPRYLSKDLKFKIWNRDHEKCTRCGAAHHLNFDHIKPVSKGGLSHSKNLRLLCFHCNQRAFVITKTRDREMIN